ncbi:hypothetical protein OROGR_009934 [Orobanche gracilis]
MVGRDPDHEYIYSLFLVEKDQQPERRTMARRITGTIYEIIQGLIRRSGTITKNTFPSILMKLLKGNDNGGGGGSSSSSSSNSRPLPEDVVIDILQRLAPEHILICRMVCKRWMSLTSTPLFHVTSATPVILLQHRAPNYDTKLYYLDLTPDEPCILRVDSTKLPFNGQNCSYGGTCNGLVLFWRRERFGTLLVSIYNPLTGREITLSPIKADYYMGFWFHPFKRDYFFLTRSNGDVGELRRWGFLYKIFNLRGECTVLGRYAAAPSSSHMPINVNGSLYFLLKWVMPFRNPRNCIMIFNIESEEIDFKAHPHNDHCNDGHGGNFGVNRDMCLNDVDGSLGFTHLCSIERSLRLWVLEGCATWKWIPRYKININWHIMSMMDPICALSSTQNREIVMHYRYQRLFSFNLETMRIRKIDISIIGVPTRFITACTYRRSIVYPSLLSDQHT